MGIATYASLRSQLPAPTIAVAAGGNLTGSGTLEISVQGRNRAGFNLPTALQAVGYSAGQKIQIAIPASARADGEDIHWYVISVATVSGDLSSIRQVAIYNGYGVDQVTPSALPITIELSEDDHIAVGSAQTVASLAALPTGANLINGMIRQVTNVGDSSSRILRYDSQSVATVDNDTVFNAASGRWIQVSSFSTYISNTENAGGSDRVLTLLPPSAVLQPPTYAADGSTSTPVKYWWYGTRNAAGSITQQGTRIGFRVFDDGIDKTSQFDGLLQLTFDGYVDPATGALDTAGMTTGGSAPFAFGKAGAIALENDLPAGQAAQFSIQAKFTSAQLKDIADGSKISIRPRSFSQSGDVNPVSGFTGNGVFPVGDRLRIVTGSGLSVQALSGSAAVGRLTFPLQDAIAVTGLVANTADQIIEINGNGNVFVGDGTIGANEAIRAKVGTVAGRSPASNFSDYAAVTNGQTLTVTITNGRDIRTDYPEPSTAISVIAGNTEATFNPPLIVIYLERESDGQIWEFTGNAVLDAATQQVNITNLSAGTAIANLPTVSPTFSLFKPSGSFSANAGSSDLTADNYRVAIAYEYDGNQTTQIQHEAESSDWLEETEALSTISSQVAGNTSAIAANATQISTNVSAIAALQNPAILPKNAQTGTSYTLDLADVYKAVTFENAAAITATIPPNSSAAFPVGSILYVGKKGAGDIALTPGNGVTLNGGNGAITLSQQWGLRLLWQATENAWWLDVPGVSGGGGQGSGGGILVPTHQLLGWFEKYVDNNTDWANAYSEYAKLTEVSTDPGDITANNDGARFNGVPSTYFETNSKHLLNIGITDFSVHFHFEIHSFPADLVLLAISTSNPGLDSRLHFLIESGNQNEVRFRTEDASNAANLDVTPPANSGFFATDGSQYVVQASYNATTGEKKMRIGYIPAVGSPQITAFAVQTQPLTPLKTLANHSLRVGNSLDFSGYANATFYNIAVYERVLTKAEFDNIWNDGSPKGFS